MWDLTTRLRVITLLEGGVAVLHIVMCCFLQADKLLPTYLELYDIVLTGDASMDLVNAVLNKILT